MGIKIKTIDKVHPLIEGFKIGVIISFVIFTTNNSIEMRFENIPLIEGIIMVE